MKGRKGGEEGGDIPEDKGCKTEVVNEKKQRQRGVGTGAFGGGGQ